jgi:gliding motility-associated-like protein
MAQNITRLEYFFDNDPGYGNGTAVGIVASGDQTQNFTANLAGLSTGPHTLYIRTKDANAKWSLLNSKPIIIQNKVQGGSTNIVRLEYFFDTDPGFGVATSIPVTPSTDILKNQTINLTGLSDGFHNLYMRAKDAAGSWSLLAVKSVIVQPFAQVGPLANINRIEYFLDNDPGFGNGTPITFTTSASVTQNAIITLGSVSPGFHTMVIRAKNGVGRWSLLSSKPFVAAYTDTNITAVEYYYFDGVTKTSVKTYKAFTPGQNVTIDFNAILTGLLPATSYEIHITAINSSGQRSKETIHTFTTPAVICNITAPSASNVNRCDNGTITLTATGAGAPPANYNWFDVATGGSVLVNGPVYSPTLSATQTFYVNIVDGLGICESVRTPVVATVGITPSPPLTNGGSTCVPASLTLSATGGTNGQYRWYTTPSGGVPISGAINGTFVTPVISTTTTYYVSIVNGTCESPRVPAIAAFCNRPPAITAASVDLVIGATATVNLPNLISDLDNNLDLSTLKVVAQPASGASASIDADHNLVLNYGGKAFAGKEEITIEVCDLALVCTRQIITVEVVGDIVIYNAISPNGDKKNDIWFIQYIDLLDDSRNNHVTVFNRWGDEVFEATDYDNVSNVFTGLNKAGNELPTGVYFYKIEFTSARKMVTGYLSLRR